MLLGLMPYKKLASQYLYMHLGIENAKCWILGCSTCCILYIFFLIYKCFNSGLNLIINDFAFIIQGSSKFYFEDAIFMAITLI